MLNKPSIGIVIPWREQPQRLKAFRSMKNHYQDFFADKEIFWADDGSELFCRSHSINAGMKYFFDRGFDLVMVNDADTICEISSLHEAIDIAYKNNKIVLPYDTYVDFRKDGSLNPKVANRQDINELHPCSGSMIVPNAVYRDIGGFDENFIGWGPEDQEYHYRYYLKYGEKFKYVDGKCFSLQHGKLTLTDQIIKNHEYACNKYPDSFALKYSFEYLLNYFNEEQQ